MSSPARSISSRSLVIRLSASSGESERAEPKKTIVSRMRAWRIRSAGSMYSERILRGRAATLLRNLGFKNDSSLLMSFVICHLPLPFASVIALNFDLPKANVKWQMTNTERSSNDPLLFKLSGLAAGQADDDLVPFDRLDLDLSVRGQFDHVARPNSRLFPLAPLAMDEEQ